MNYLQFLKTLNLCLIIETVKKVTALEAEKRKTYPVLFKWLKVNFAEAYQAWIHIKVSWLVVFKFSIILKALRIFVESVLRYGLPVNFRAAIVIPGRNQKKLRDKLNQIFESLDSAGGFNQAWGLICWLVENSNRTS